jgi:hypothetical protein
VQRPQLFGVDPIYTPPIPFGTGALFEPVPSGGVVVGRTDQVACAAWPTAMNPPPYSVAAPPKFHIELDGAPPAGSLLQACLTVQGVVPRTCLGV